MSVEQIKEYLFNKGISSNYNEPMSKEQINRLNEKQVRTIYNNIIATHNLVNIQQVKGEDLEMVDTDKYDYIWTYSFPCQDLSNAGLKKGFNDTSTRSGMLWEVERILEECDKIGQKPRILLMENVIQVHSPGENLENFHKWQLKLESLGYKNYMQDLIATDYGIPQTRNRCFMVSILGDYSYTFPQPIPLKLKLKDMLEDEVDKKYYLSNKTLEQISNWKSYQNPLDSVMGKESISPTITTRIAESQDGGINASMKVYCDELWETTSIRIKNATTKGYIEATEGDGIDLAQPNSETRRGRVQKEAIQTLTTQNNLGVCVGTYQYSKSDNFMQGKDRLQLGKEVRDTLQTTQKEGIVYSDLRIRKLTPKECGRLMSVADEDIEKILKNQSNASAYHLFGDSICCNVLMAIFGELLDIDWKKKVDELLNGNTN
jgi:DNA (cytosine-5)-methyltransferase 1